MATTIITTRSLTVNLIPGGVPPVLPVSQYDTATSILFTVYDGSSPFTIPDDVSIKFNELKSDGYGVSVAVTRSSSNASQCYVWMTSQMAAVAGDQLCELSFTTTGSPARTIGTANFILRVERAPIDDNTVISASQIAYAEQVLEQLGSVSAYGNRLAAVESGKAPNDHATTAETYGLATDTKYGHVKLIDTIINGDDYSDVDGTALSGNAGTQLFTRTYANAMSMTWTYGGSFNSSSSYCSLWYAGSWHLVNFAVVTSAAIAANTDRNIITNLPPARHRVYIPAFAVTSSGVVTVMCAIRPEESASNSNRILKIDAATNPTAIASGTYIYGSFMYAAAGSW